MDTDTDMDMRTTGKPKVKHYPNSIKMALSKKKCLWHKFHNNPKSSTAQANYKLAASKCKILIRNYEIKKVIEANNTGKFYKFVNRRLSCNCLLYTSPSPRDRQKSRMPSSA